ncbi:multidrug ABC transporter ATP-binding protein [Paractinoplanes abujensis]|uniref:Putative ABC transport system ATP-binding protein n=1 Tax=Paractinoplanes abujensis TaxID=882441 RepID=A0A7W7CU23_9ACTN|nr:ABC transporter ATP-binding protein [Actinoplanes abujensis]MBB4694709.1 putative ABC transport system ATP-binding protein [Actinoplanes abujensis]GID20079.1 multidrug ABC transporter ATP-binding protein [Actinoplanes abujensis]
MTVDARGPGVNLLWRALIRNRVRVASGSLLSGVQVGCEALVPVLIGVIVDRAVATQSLSRLVFWVCALGSLFLVLTVAYRTGARRLMRAIADEAHRLRLEVAAKVLDPRTEVRTGDVLTISATDADTASYLLDYLPRLFGALVATAVSAIGLFVISVPLGLVVLIGTPVVLAGLQRAAPRITRRVAARQEVAGRAASVATDLVTGLRPLRGIGAQDAAAHRYREVSRESLGATLRAAKTLGWFQAASDTVSTLVACGIAILAGWFALTGRISAGELVTVIGLAAFLSEPFATLSAGPGWLASARASAARIQAVLDLVPTQPPTGDNPISPVRGECVGIVAEPDAGALVALFDDGSPDVLVAPHLPELFTGTIRENLIDVAGTDPPGTLPAVLRASAADDVVAAHPDGLDHAIADRGAALSGGQRQRLALARALLARPRLLVLHEPTTAVDAVTEHAIARGIRDLRHGPGSTLGTLLVTTSPALLAITDRVIVLRDGEVVATGTHAALAATDETYRAAVLR